MPKHCVHVRLDYGLVISFWQEFDDRLKPEMYPGLLFNQPAVFVDSSVLLDEKQREPKRLIAFSTAKVAQVEIESDPFEPSAKVTDYTVSWSDYPLD